MLKKCKDCGKEISKSAKKCVSCGRDQRNIFMQHKIITVVGVVFVLFVLGGAVKPNPTSKVVNTMPKEVIYNVGETIKTSKFEITITKVEAKTKVGKQYFYKTPSEGGIYCCVQWMYKNITNEPIGRFSFPSIDLVNKDGVTYSHDFSASSSFATENNNDTKFLSDLNPGILVKDSLAFEISRTEYEKDGWIIRLKADQNLAIKLK